MRRLILTLTGLLIIVQLTGQSPSHKADELIKAYVSDGKFNGTVLVAKDGRIILEKGYGVSNAAGSNNTAGTIFQVGSITKQFTSAIVLMLEKEKKLSVADKLNKYFPGFPRSDEITIENLLTHTSGIYNYTNDREFMMNKVTIPHSPEQMIALFREKPLNFDPGTKWEYSNSAYVLLGYIIEKTSGKSYEQMVRQRIFQPLGMNHSGFDFTNLKSPEKATGYYGLGTDPPVTAPIVDSTIAYSAGAIYTTVGDLYKWDRALYTENILDASQRKRSFTAFMNKYGYGWGVDSLFGKLTVSHGGGIHGFASYILRFPNDNAVIILIDNASGTSLGKLGRTLAAIIFDLPYEIPKEQKTVAVEEKLLQEYAGEYELTPDFIITVRANGGKLTAQATGQQELELFAENETNFFLKIVDAKVEFTRNADGKVNQLILYQGGAKQTAKKIK